MMLVGSLAMSIQGGLTLPVLPLFLFSRGFSFSQLGIMISLVAAFSIFLRLYAAKHQALLGHRYVIIALAGIPVIAFPLYLVVETPLGFIAVMTATVTSGVIFGLGYQTLVAQVIPGKHMTQAYALFRVGGDMGFVVGLVAGGFLMAQSFSLAFYFASLTGIVALFVTASLLLNDRGTPPKKEPGGSDNPFRGPLRAANRDFLKAYFGIMNYSRRLVLAMGLPKWGRRNISWVSLHMLLFGIALFMYPVYLPLILISNGLEFEWVGMIIAGSWTTFGITGIIGSTIADMTRQFRLLILASLLLGSLLNVVMWWGSLTVLIVAWILLGVADGIGRPVTQSYLVTSIPSRAIGTGFAMTESAFGFARIAGPLFFAIWISAFGLQSGLLGAAGLMLLSAAAIAFVRAPPVKASQGGP